MKKVNSLVCAITLSSFLPVSNYGELGIIKLLRGEPEKIQYQRVAFVGSAVVKQAHGKVERLCGIDSWEPLARGSRLMPGDMVRNTNGELILKMESGSFVRATPGTLVRLAPFDSSLDQTLKTPLRPNSSLASVR